MARSLATAHESVKTQTCGLLPLSNRSTAARNTAYNSAHQTDQFLLSLNRVVAFQTGCHPFNLELSSIDHAALCSSADSCSQGTVHVTISSDSSSCRSKVSVRGESLPA